MQSYFRFFEEQIWSISDDTIDCMQVHDMKDQVQNLVVSNNVSCFIPHGAGLKVCTNKEFFLFSFFFSFFFPSLMNSYFLLLLGSFLEWGIQIAESRKTCEVFGSNAWKIILWMSR